MMSGKNYGMLTVNQDCSWLSQLFNVGLLIVRQGYWGFLEKAFDLFHPHILQHRIHQEEGPRRCTWDATLVRSDTGPGTLSLPTGESPSRPTLAQTEILMSKPEQKALSMNHRRHWEQYGKSSFLLSKREVFSTCVLGSISYKPESFQV
jgi:hypothetical protein